MFTCSKCSKSFEYKRDFETHTNKKRDCTLKLSIVKHENEKNCIYCGKSFRPFDLDIHLKSGKSDCFIERLKMIATVKGNLAPQTTYINPVFNIGDHFNNINNNTNIKLPKIKFAKHGKENVDHITKAMVLELFQEKFSIVCVELMKLIYFNEKVPENCSWVIAYPKSKNAAVVYNKDEDEFEKDFTEKVIEDKFANMIESLFPLVRSIQDDVVLYPTLSEMQKGNLVRFLSHLGYRIATESPFIYKIIRKLCYDQRCISMKIWAQHGYKGNHLSLKFV